MEICIKPGRRLFKSALFLTGFLSLLAFAFLPAASAKIQDWDLKKSEDYQFDSRKVKVEKGNAELVRLLPYVDQGKDFEAGSYQAGTQVQPTGVSLSSQALVETEPPGLAAPLQAGETGRVALWHFDEPNGTNVLDEVGRTVAKTSDAEVTSGQPGFSYARLFDGNKSYVFIPHYRSLEWDGPFSVEMWIRPTNPQSLKPQTIVSRWQTVGAQKGFALQISPDGKLDFVVSPDGALSIHHPGQSVLAPGVWYHVAAVFTGEDLRIYLNGALDGTPTLFSGPIFQSSNPIYLGALVDNRVDQFFAGVIDEAAFYNYALSEIETLTHAGNPRGLVGLWHLNERSGVVNDNSGYGHMGIAYAAPVYESEGKLGTSIRFNGMDQFIETSPSSRLAPQDHLTLSAWINAEMLPGLDQRMTILSSSGGEYSISLAGPDGNLVASAAMLNPQEIKGHLPINAGNWHFVTAAWSNGEVRLYVDGILDTAAGYSGKLNVEKTALRVGIDSKNMAGFRGMIDEAAVYRRALSASEIAAAAGLFSRDGLYTSAPKDSGDQPVWKNFSVKKGLDYGRETSADETGLLHLYHFNERDAHEIKDSKSDLSLGMVATYGVPGVFSNARWFAVPGTDKLISEREVPSLSTFSFSFWFQFAAKEPGMSDRLLSIGDEKLTIYRSLDGRLHVRMEGARDIHGDRILKDSTWHHLTLTGDGRNLFLYIDGMLDGNSPLSAPLAAAPLVLGNLKSVDTFRGAIDELAFYNYALEREAIFRHFLKGKTDLKFLLRDSDDNSFANVKWRGPAGERSFEMEPGADTAGVWRLNDPRFTGEAGEVKDSSRHASHGTTYGHVEPSSLAIYGTGALFNGAGDFIVVPDASNLHPAEFTISAWVKPEQIQNEAVLVDKRFQKGPPSFSSFALELTGYGRLALRLGRPGGYNLITTDRDGEVAAGRWSYVTATYNRKEARLYINGELKKAVTFTEPVPYDEGGLYFGRYGSSPSRYFRGQMDEVRLEGRALSEQEIQQIFAQADPENYFYGTGSESLSLGRGRFLQYQALFSTAFPAASPLLEGVEIRANDFSSERPFVSNLRSISYADISHFREKLGPRHKGAVTYQISNDGLNWFFHNGRRWVAAGGVKDSNTAVQVEGRIRDFAKELGAGSFYFKAFLHSPTGSEPVEFQGVELEYLPNKLTLTSPNGGETWRVESEQEIRWDSTGEVKSVTLEYSSDDFQKDFRTIAENISNKGNYSWKIPNEPMPNVKIRVRDNLDPRVHDISDIPFRMTGSFELISPNYAERWEVGSKQTIKWRTQGNIPEVKLDFSIDDFREQIYPVVSVIKNKGMFEWEIPDNISSNVKVRVSDARDPLVYDQSNDVFSIIGKFSIQSPKSDVRWIVGSTQEIRWTTVGTVAAVRLEYQSKESPEWKLIADKVLNRNHFSWEIPNDIHPEIRIRVSNAQDSSVLGTSEPFAIIGGLRLVHPRGGESWSVGSKRKIAWQTIGDVSTVDLEYQLPGDKEWKTIAAAVPNTGDYVWEVPDALAESAVVRVKDSKDAQVKTGEAVSIAILPGFTLLYPNGNESWQIGSEQDIVWETKGSIEQVNLDYSKDGFAKDVQRIIAGASNIGRFTWTVPDDAAPRVWVRVSDPKHPSAYDSSDAPFRIFADFRLKFPAGGEKFEVGSLATLEWETRGNVPEVRLEYSHDDFVKDHRTIVESVHNQGRHTWTIPDDIGQNYSVRISDVRDPATAHISEARFSILGKFRLLEPAGGEHLIAGSIVPVRWKGAGSVPVVTIDYSENDFKDSFQTIVQSAPNSGTYQWTVPNLIGHKFKLRIWDPSHPEAMDIMSAPARIIGGFRLVAPNGGEVLYVGDKTEIQWETSGAIPRVKLEISSDGFTRDIIEIADSYENVGRYVWQIPDLLSGAYRIRISDPRDSTAFDLSNSEFRIRSHMTLIQPNGGEGWPVGEKQTIRWKTSASIPHVQLEYTTDDFKTVHSIAEAAPNSGFYEWVVPNDVSQNVKVRISDMTDPGGFDLSDKPFRIQGLLRMTSPNGAEVWKVGEEHAITWETSGNVPVVKIEYSRDGFASDAKTIVESTSNSGSFNWRVPDDLSAQVKIRITDIHDTVVQDSTDAYFQIAASFLMMAPNGGEVWHANEKREINWMTVGTVREIILELSKDDFKTEPDTIDRGVLNQGRFTWEVPETLGENFKVRVCDMDNPKICDVSDNIFSIRSPLEIVYPKGGEVWQIGTDQEIRWNTFGNVRQVTIEYSTAKPHMEWKKLAEELPNQNHFLFRVPDQVSEEVLFRVADLGNESLSSTTQVPVKFLGNVRLLTPNGGEVWRAESEQKIMWETLGTISNVRLEYSQDDFVSDIHIMEASYGNTGSYNWKVPAEPMKQVKVRVSDAAHRQTADASDAPFRIAVGFKVLFPNGGERLQSGEKALLAWDTFGKSQRVKLEYGVKNNETYEWKLISDAATNNGRFQWEVPADLSSSDMKIRVTDSEDSTALDESDQPFKTLARFSITAPKPEEVLIVGGKYQLQWKTYGKVPSVKLEVTNSLDRAEDPSRPVYHQVLEEQWKNSGSYFWTVPDAIHENLWIKITDAAEAEASGVMKAPFKIRGELQMQLPDGKLIWPVGSTQTLQWKTTGSIERVKLEYSTDNNAAALLAGKNWKTIAESIPNAGNFAWTIPADNAAQARIRVSDASNAEVFSIGPKTIALPASFAFERPAGGERWITGTAENLRWKTFGNVENVRLEYGINGKWNSIAGPIVNEGMFKWQVPDSISPEVRIRVRDEADPNAVLESAPFSIAGALELVQPSEEEIWPVGSRQTIAWTTTGTIPQVRIEALMPAPFIIADGLRNQNHFEWTVPDKIANDIRIRVVDARDEITKSVSAKAVSIIGAFQFVSPNGGETPMRWTVGSNQQIAWKTQGSVSSVLLEYSRDDFFRDINKIAADVPNTGAALWTIPDAISDNVKIRISDFKDGRAFQISRPFKIQGAFTFSVPSNGQIWTVGTKQNIVWKTTGTIPKVRLEYSRDDFNRDIQVVQNEMSNQGGIEWVVPDAISSTVKLRVSDANDAAVFGISDLLKINGALDLKTPAGGESLQVFSPFKITWDTIGSIAKVRLEYFRNQDTHIIHTSAENSGFYDWNVPDDIGAGFKIRVSDAGNPSVMDETPLPFQIHGAISLTSALEGRRLIAGAEEALTWETIGTIPFVRLEYSKDDFTEDVHAIALSQQNRGRFIWKVSDDISQNVKIRISDLRNVNVQAMTNAPFAIVGKLELAPLEATALHAGDTAMVRWKTTGTVPAVRLEYSLDPEGRIWKLITGAVENKNEFEWQVPDDIALQVRLRVSDTRDELTQDILKNPFSIMPAFEFLSPSGGERWIVGTAHEIKWQVFGTVPDVQLQYSTDNFKKDIQDIAESTLNNGRLAWVVPDAISDSVSLRILDSRYPESASRLSNAFSIIGDFVITNPAEDQTVKVASPLKIEWQSVGSMPFVKLEFSRGGESPFEAIQDRVSNQGFYEWKVPDKIGEGVQLRISDSHDPNVAALAPGKLKIQGNFDWKTPAGGENWIVGAEQVLEWKTTGTIPVVQIDFSRDGFDRDIQPVAPSIANENRLKWKVPDWIGNGQVRIRSSSDPSLSVVSPSFNIKGRLELVEPAGGKVLKVGNSAEIRWIYSGTIPLVRLEYSLDDFQQDVRLIEQALETSRFIQNEGEPASYLWTVPDAISRGARVKIRIADVRDPEVSSVSPKPFKISGGFEILVPQGGETWTVNMIQNLVWKTTGSIPEVRLEFSRDGFKRDIQKIEKALPNQGGFAWTVPDTISDRVWLRITDSADEDASAALKEPFVIQGALKLTSPVGGERWHVGDEIDFQWEAAGTIPQVRIEYFDAAASERLTKAVQEKIPNAGHFLWRIPDFLAPQTHFRVVDVRNEKVYSETQVPVKILGTLKFIAPDVKSRWVAGSTQKLAWETRGFVPKVKLEYSRDGFQQDLGVIEPLIDNTGAGEWMVGNLIAKNLQLRVSDVENADVFALTQAPIEITGGLKVSSPAGGEVWEVGSSAEILWQTAGSVPYVRIEYSRDNFSSEKVLIADKLPNTGRLTWKVADALSKNVKIRVTDSSNEEVFGTSEKSFAITGRLFLVSPQGGEIWKVADAATIQWNTVGSIARVGLEYSLDDFIHSTVIAKDIPNQGRFIWRVPDQVSDNIKVRVFDASDPAVFSVTSTPLKIQGTLTLVVPQGKELWRIGSVHTILWQTTGTVASVKLEYSNDNFATAVTIVEGLANQGRFEWTVPDITTDHLRLRVSNAADGSVAVVSEVLEIGGLLELVAPAGGEVWRVGETQDIRWKTTGTVPRVRLEISKDQFRNDVQVLEASLVNTGGYSWKVPDRIGEGFSVRISDAANQKLTDTSKAPFKILGILNFEKPRGGEKWPVGSRQTITWNTTGTIPYVRLEYSRDDFVSAFPIETNLKNEGRYVWQIPDLTGSDVRFRISDVRDPVIAAETRFPVSVSGLLHLLTPSGGEKWTAQSKQSITWDTIGTIPNVSLEYRMGDAPPVTIASTIANNGSYLWTVPDLNTRDLRIRLFDSLHPEIAAQTPSGIEIHGKFQLTSPAGGEIWFVGSEHPITWTTAGKIPYVRLEYSTDRFRTVLPAAIKLPNQGRFLWQVPDVISREVYFRVVDDANASVLSKTEKPFEVRGTLSMVSPSGGEIWAVGTRHPISWQTSGTIPQVRLEYSIDDFTNHSEVIAPALANKGVYYWEVPAIPAQQAKVRVTDTANSEVYDISRNPFRIAGEITMVSPNNGETYRVGERIEIRWHATSNVSNVKLEYSTDDFETTHVVTDFVPNTGKYVWNIPDLISDNVRIRVSDSSNAMVYSLSKVPFRIVGSLRWISPRGGEIWQVGSRQTLKWETLGSIPKVRLEYSWDNFKTSLPLSAGIANTGSFDWVVPELEFPEIRFRVSDAASPSVEAFTQDKVQVTGKLSLVSPAGGERWVAGEERAIRWETLGFISKVDLEYSKDEFNRDIHLIAASVPNVGSYSWKIPNDLSPNVRVRVRSSTDVKVASISEAPMKIDLYAVRWVVKDRVSGEYLTGLRLSDSTGKTQDALASSVSLQYPYGIYTTVWTKPGYSEYRSTWLADKDQTFTVLLEPETQKLEMVRSDFSYDRDKDLMEIRTWYEKDGRPVPAVIQTEIKIYDGHELIKTLSSTNPDNRGIFLMAWDTSVVPGDKRYGASAVITASSGKILTSPISYQINLPVKEKKEPVLKPRLDSPFLKPLGVTSSYKPLPSVQSLLQKPLPAKPTLKKEEKTPETPKTEAAPKTETVPQAKPRAADPEVLASSQLVVPEKGVLGETLSISYFTEKEVSPVVDVYDADRRLAVRAQKMTMTEPGKYTYLLTLKGLSFIPGKPVTVSVIERLTGRFKTAQIMIQSSTSALGWDQEAGTETILSLLGRLDKLNRQVQSADKDAIDMESFLASFESGLSELSGLLLQGPLKPAVMEKLNKLAEDLADLARQKGYRADFLTSRPLSEGATPQEIKDKVRRFQNVLEMLRGLYLAASGSPNAV